MMFPMIPQYFYSKPTECAGFNSSVAEKVIDIVKSPKVRKKFKIIVAGVIDVDVESDNIPVDELLDGSDDELQEQIRIYSEGNTLRCNTKTWSWLKQVPLAEDCHSCNVILYQECASIIKIKTVRKILPAEELVLWFSGELLSVLQIPHLLPNNILSEKQYVCHKCRFQCEMPNPIKIHLSLDCGKSSKTSLWNRLRELQEDIIDRPSSQNSMSLYFDKKVDLSVSNSAFKPYKKVVKEESSHDKVIPDKKKLLTDTTVKESVAELSEADILYQQAVEMETIVSNLGRFKQGHLCVFCGKVYSRKYGLKIHTRTHTGFRPLKCKYCLRPFGDPSNLNKHVRLHSEGNTPYKCELCGKILVRKRDLERHMKSRH